MKKLKVNKQKLKDIIDTAFVWALIIYATFSFVMGFVAFTNLSFELAICGLTLTCTTNGIVMLMLNVMCTALVLMMVLWFVHKAVIESIRKEKIN